MVKPTRDTYRKTGTHTKKLTNDDLVELAKNFTIVEIAYSHGYTHEGVRKRLKRLGIIPQKQKYTRRRKERSFDLDLLYRDSVNLGLLKTARKHHMDYCRLKSLLPYSPGKVRSKLPSVTELKELIKSSNTAQEVADKYKVKRVSVYNRLSRAGISIKTIERRNGNSR